MSPGKFGNLESRERHFLHSGAVVFPLESAEVQPPVDVFAPLAP